MCRSSLCRSSLFDHVQIMYVWVEVISHVRGVEVISHVRGSEKVMVYNPLPGHMIDQLGLHMTTIIFRPT